MCVLCVRVWTDKPRWTNRQVVQLHDFEEVHLQVRHHGLVEGEGGGAGWGGMRGGGADSSAVATATQVTTNHNNSHARLVSSIRHAAQAL